MALTRYAKYKARRKYAEAVADVRSTLGQLWPDAQSTVPSPAYCDALTVTMTDTDAEPWVMIVAVAPMPVSGLHKAGHRWQWPRVDPVKMVATVEALEAQLPPPAFSIRHMGTKMSAQFLKQMSADVFGQSTAN